MTDILDQTGDINGQQLHRLLTLYSPPEFVKQADSGAIFGQNDLKPGHYADPVRSQFPCHTKAATWVSALFFLDQGNKVNNSEDIKSRLVKFAKFHGISKDITDLVEKFASRVDTDPLHELPNSDFALVFTKSDGVCERHCPLRNPAEIKTAAEYIKKWEDVIPLSERQAMAQRIMDKAADLGVSFGPLEEYVEKQAGYGVCAAKDAANFIRSRIVELERRKVSKEIKEELQKMAEACEKASSKVRERGNLSKLAAIIDNIDRAYGLHHEYARIGRPEDVLFGITIKAAGQFLEDHCSTSTGNMYKIADLSKLPLDDLRAAFGDDFAGEVSMADLAVAPNKLAEHLSAMAKPEAEILDRLLAASGVVPVTKEASTAKDDDWLSNRDFLSEVAALRP